MQGSSWESIEEGALSLTKEMVQPIGASTCHSRLEEVLAVVSSKHLKVELGDCPVVKGTCFSCEGPEFGSLHPCQASHSCP